MRVWISVKLQPLAVTTLHHPAKRFHTRIMQHCIKFYAPVGEGEADVLLVLVVAVSGKSEAGERGGGESHLSRCHHTATHTCRLKFVTNIKCSCTRTSFTSRIQFSPAFDRVAMLPPSMMTFSRLKEKSPHQFSLHGKLNDRSRQVHNPICCRGIVQDPSWPDVLWLFGLLDLLRIENTH